MGYHLAVSLSSCHQRAGRVSVDDAADGTRGCCRSANAHDGHAPDSIVPGGHCRWQMLEMWRSLRLRVVRPVQSRSSRRYSSFFAIYGPSWPGRVWEAAAIFALRIALGARESTWILDVHDDEERTHGRPPQQDHERAERFAQSAVAGPRSVSPVEGLSCFAPEQPISRRGVRRTPLAAHCERRVTNRRRFVRSLPNIR